MNVVAVLVIIVLFAVMLLAEWRSNKTIEALRTERNTARDEIQRLHNVSAVQDANLNAALALAEERYEEGYKVGKEGVFTEHGEVRVGYGPLLRLDPFPAGLGRPGPLGTLPPPVDDASVRKLIDRAVHDFVIENYDAGYSIRSKVDVSMIRFEEPYNFGGPMIRFQMLARGTPLVATPDRNDEQVQWVVRSTKIDTGSVDVRPRLDEEPQWSNDKG